jgi:hypothetical protein
VAVTGRKLSPHDTTRWTVCKGYGLLRGSCPDDPLPGHFLCKWCEVVRVMDVEIGCPIDSPIDIREAMLTVEEWDEIAREQHHAEALIENAWRANAEPEEVELHEAISHVIRRPEPAF